MLSQTAEYALRAVCALASRLDELVPTSELAGATDVPPPYLAKVLQQLAAADLIRGRRGVGGGYKLVRDPNEITMLDVVNAVSAIRKIRTDDERLADFGFASLDRAIDQAAQAVVERFSAVTIDQLAQETDQLQATQEKAEEVSAAPISFPSSREHVLSTNGNGRTNVLSNGNGFGNGNGNGSH